MRPRAAREQQEYTPDFGLDPRTPAAPGFGLALREAREARWLSQPAIGRLVGCNDSLISRLEHGTRNPSRSLALALCDALGLTGFEREELLNLAGYTELVWTRDAWAAQVGQMEQVA